MRFVAEPLEFCKLHRHLSKTKPRIKSALSTNLKNFDPNTQHLRTRSIRKTLYERALLRLNEPMADPQTTSQSVSEDMNFEDMLVDVGQNKNKESFIGLFNHFAPRIKSFLMKGGLNEGTADDLAQDTMLTLWNNAENFDPSKAAASTWIFTIARNKRIDALRKSSRVQLSDIEDQTIADDGRSPAQKVYCREKSAKISQAMKDLPQEQFELVKKSFFEDKSHSAIAKETGIPLGTVKSRIRSALDTMRHKSGVKELWH